MAGFLERILGRERRSARQAKERLKTVLSHDRSDLSPGALEALKDEMIAVISRHVEIDPAATRINLEHDGRRQRLIANIPLATSRGRRYR